MNLSAIFFFTQVKNRTLLCSLIMTVTLETGSQVELNGHHPCPFFICCILSVPFIHLCPFASLSLISLKSDQVKQNKAEMSGWVPPASFSAESSHMMKNTRALSEWAPVEKQVKLYSSAYLFRETWEDHIQDLHQDSQGQNQSFAALFAVITVLDLLSLSCGYIISSPKAALSVTTHSAAEGDMSVGIHRFYSYVTQRNCEPSWGIWPVV